MYTKADLTVLITTKNRKDELRKALLSTLEQDVQPQILVLDDGSTDGTSEMVRAEFPTARVHREEQSLGVIRARNRGIELAQTEVVVTIDDDCVFSSPTILRQVLTDISPERVGALNIPLVDVHHSSDVRGRAPDDKKVWLVRQFQGGANAVKRTLFLRLGGLRGDFIRQGEETDYCLRMLSRGFVTRMGNGEPILHYESPIRDRSKIIYYQTRNNILIVFFNAPALVLVPWMAATLYRVTRAGFHAGYARATLKGLAAGLAGCVGMLRQRHAIPLPVYLLYKGMSAEPMDLESAWTCLGKYSQTAK